MAHIGFVCLFQFLSKDGLKLVTLSKNNVEARGRDAYSRKFSNNYFKNVFV